MKIKKSPNLQRAILLSISCLLHLPLAVAQMRERTIVLEGARLIDGTGREPLANAVLLVEGGIIRAVGKKGSMRYPSGAEVVDLQGKTIIPSLINLHGHLGLSKGLEQSADSYTVENIRGQLEKYLAYGVGTVVSLGTDQELIYTLRQAQRDREDAGNSPEARLYTAGRGFGVQGGYPPTPANAGDRYRPQTAEEARAEVQKLASRRPDFIKIWVDDDFGRVSKMKPEIFRAIIDEAHQHGLRVVAHVFYLGDAKALILAGVDALGHSIRDQAVDQDVIAAMKARGILLVPTLVRDESTFIFADRPVWLENPFFRAGLEPGALAALKNPAFAKKFRSNPDLPKLQAAFEMAKKNLKSLFVSGVKVGFGTDSGPPLRFQGYFEHRELQLMVESGLTPMQAIVCATRNSAQFLGAGSEFGTLEPGRYADFLVLDANPLDDIHNTEKLSAVWQAGKAMKAIHAGK